MQLSVPSTCWLLLLATCASHVAASRVNIAQQLAHKNIEKEGESKVVKKDIVETPSDRVETPSESPSDYWSAHKGSWEFVGLVNDEVNQQFELKEKNHRLKMKQYEAKLEEFEHPETNIEIRKNINAPVLKVTNYFWTAHAHQEALFKNEDGVQVGDYMLFNPNAIFNRRYTWRVVKTSDPSNVLFTIQKRLYNDHCKWFGLFSCRPVLKIYVGHRGDKSELIYYGVGDKDLDEPDFKFYHSEEAYKAARHKWVAKVDHKKEGKRGEDKYKVKVKAGEDAGLILLATTCLDKIGDEAQEAEGDD